VAITTANSNAVDWAAWSRFFEKRSQRPLPPLDLRTNYSNLPASLGQSLATFQLAESGGGKIAAEARNSRLKGIDKEYAAAIDLFVREERRHANILAMCVRLLGGSLLQRDWTATMFTMLRRIGGLRSKVLVLLAAEVVGICYYSTIASQLQPGPVQRWLLELVNDERAHLRFHCSFLRSQTDTRMKRLLFVGAWRVVSYAAMLTVIVHHRQALRDMQLDFGVVWQRWMAVSQQARRLVVNQVPTTLDAELNDGHCPV